MFVDKDKFLKYIYKAEVIKAEIVIGAISFFVNVSMFDIISVLSEWKTAEIGDIDINYDKDNNELIIYSKI